MLMEELEMLKRNLDWQEIWIKKEIHTYCKRNGINPKKSYKEYTKQK